MARRLPPRLPPSSDNPQMESGMRKLEQMIDFEQKLCAHQNCNCLICHNRSLPTKPKPIVSSFTKDLDDANTWLRRILIGLTPQGTPSLKLFIPGFFFVDGDIVEIFYTDYRQNRVAKSPGTTPVKMLFSTMLRMRRDYKSMLEQGFRRSMLDKIDPNLVHEKYMEQVIPSHFHNGEDSTMLRENRQRFQKYILHQNPNYIIESIEEHKINENEAFCSVRFQDASLQLFTQKEFETFLILKSSSNNVHYAESYIKEKQDTNALFTSGYTFSKQIDYPDLYQRAELEVLVLIGGIGKYHAKYEDLEILEDSTHELMINDPQAYSYYSTYRILHYLSMVSRIYVKHIKINWILNDTGYLYLHDIFELETTDISLLTLKYRMPPKVENLELYRDAKNFSIIYKQLQHSRNLKRIKAREDISTLNMAKPTQQSTQFATIDHSGPILNHRRRRTIDVTEFSNSMKSMDMTNKDRRSRWERWEKGQRSPQKKEGTHKLSFFQKNVRYRNLTSLDKYQF